MKNIKTCILFLVICSFISACNSVNSQKVENSNLANTSIKPKPEKLTSPQKAVKIAEEFIARNGHTKKPADRENLSYESVTFASNVDEVLELRHDSLEPKAYGYLNKAKDKKGWTVIFQRSESRRKQDEKDKIKDFANTGRAVTMDENFENLRVEHKDFILKFAKKL